MVPSGVKGEKMREIFKKILAIIFGAIGGMLLVSLLEYKYKRCCICGGLINAKSE